MKHFLITLLAFICLAKSYGHNGYGRVLVEIVKTKHALDIKVEVRSDYFTAADSALEESLKENVYRAIRRIKQLKKGTYSIEVKFIITKDGSLSDISCIHDPGQGLCAAVLSGVKRTSTGNWIPGGAYCNAATQNSYNGAGSGKTLINTNKLNNDKHGKDRF